MKYFKLLPFFLILHSCASREHQEYNINNNLFKTKSMSFHKILNKRMNESLMSCLNSKDYNKIAPYITAHKISLNWTINGYKFKLDSGETIKWSQRTVSIYPTVLNMDKKSISSMHIRTKKEEVLKFYEYITPRGTQVYAFDKSQLLIATRTLIKDYNRFAKQKDIKPLATCKKALTASKRNSYSLEAKTITKEYDGITETKIDPHQ